MRSFDTMTKLEMASRFILFVWVCLSLIYSSHADWMEDLQDGKTLDLSDGVKVRVDRQGDGNQTSFFSAHVLKVFFGDMGVALSKAKGREGLQIELFTSSEDGNKARGTDANVFSVVLPLLIGFKIAGSILATFVALLVLSLKAFLASKLSLLITGVGALKKMTAQETPSEVHFPPMEYYPHHSPPMDYEYPSGAGYHAHASAPSAPSSASHEDHGDHDHDPEYIGPSASESNVSGQYAVPSNESSTIKYQGPKRRVYRRKNKPIPILTLTKYTKKEV